MCLIIDYYFTHNFISEKIMNLLQLLVEPIERFNVKVANRRLLKCKGRFEHVQILLQVIPFLLTLYSLPVISLDLVLGV